MRRWEGVQKMEDLKMGRCDEGPAAVGGNGIRISECGMRKIKATSRAEVQDHRSAVFWRTNKLKGQD